MRVAVAGTFGPIHDGHRALFLAALEHGDEGVAVGLTSDELARETRSEPRPVPPFEERRRRVSDELESLDEWGRDVDVVKLEEPHGTATTDPTLDALVVSPETESEVASINDARRRNGLHPIDPIVVPFVEADDGERISSTRVVNGDVDEHGTVVDGQ